MTTDITFSFPHLKATEYSKVSAMHINYVMAGVHYFTDSVNVSLKQNDALRELNSMCFEFAVNDVRCVMDIGNFPWKSPGYEPTCPVFKFDFHPALRTLGEYYPFPKVSFWEWQKLIQFCSEGYKELEDTVGFYSICARMHTYDNSEFRQHQLAGGRRRRLIQFLKEEYTREPFVLKTDVIPWHTESGGLNYLADLWASRVCVHSPGAYPGICDATILQAFAVSTVVITESVTTWPGIAPLIPWVHYLPLEPQLENLEELVHLATSPQNMKRQMQMTIDAANYFRDGCSPHAAWANVISMVLKDEGDEFLRNTEVFEERF